MTPPRVGADAVFVASDFLGVCAVLDRIMGPVRQRLAWYGMGRIGWIVVYQREKDGQGAVQQVAWKECLRVS